MRVPAVLRDVCLAAIPVLGIGWLLDVHQYLGWAILHAEFISLVAGVATAAGILAKPYRGDQPGWLEAALAVAAILSWGWGAFNHTEWLMDLANRGTEKWVPGVIAIALVVEAMRKNCGLAITILVVVFLTYGFLGHLLPGTFEAAPTETRRYILYLYSDPNAIPGLVLDVGATIVLAFIIMGKVMEISGGSSFFTDAAMATMGHRKGGPAKVAVVASSLFGTVNGTTVGNIMSTGIITIPLMRRYGFPPHYAAAIEAVASNGGQLAPPVMGTTAFLIAEFLQINYSDVALAALTPALIYYFAVFWQVDRFAERRGLTGLPKSELPRIGTVFRAGWVFMLPLGVLLYFLFWLGYSPGKSALYASALMLVLMVVRNRKIPGLAFWRDLVVGAGDNLVPLLLVCAGAGAVIGVLNITGFGFSLVLVLTAIAEHAGLLVMLAITAVIAIILGMGMPTAAVYVVLSVVLAPAIVKAGVPEMAAHLFIFYFGMLSMLTPPVAIASFVAAGLAGSNMWKTGMAALRLASVAYLLPFIFVYNPALLFQGTWLEYLNILAAIVVATALLSEAMEGARKQYFTWLPVLLGSSLGICTATLWLSTDNIATLFMAAAGIALIYARRRFGRETPA